MAKQCWIESCRDQAEEYCHHCSRDVCHHHFMEHKKWLQTQLLPVINQVNVLFNQFQRREMDQTMFMLSSMSDARHQLDQWRSECIRHVDDVYDRTLEKLTVTLDEHKQAAMEKNKQNLDALSKLRRRLQELLTEGDIAYGQIQSMKQQLEEIKTKEQKLDKHPDIRVVTDRLEADRHVHVICEHKQPEKELQREKTMKVPLTNRSMIDLYRSNDLGVCRNPVRVASPDDQQRTVKKNFSFKKSIYPVQQLDARTIAQSKRNNYRDRVAYANEYTRKKVPS